MPSTPGGRSTPGSRPRAVPASTYRVQLHGGFDFDAAADLAPYLAELGATHLYCSPYLQAAPGSTHGYDVVDHSRANAELGGEDGRRRLVRALGSAGLGQLLDIVPNHMSVGAGPSNAWWWDVLAHGSASPWAGYFDIDWDAPYAGQPSRRGRLLVPVLGSGEDASALELVEEEGALVLAYHDHRYPVAAGTADPDDAAAAVHDRQHYVLADWRRGNDELNYRRFFDVTDLAGVRVEDERVFTDTHTAVLRWYADGEIDGLRVDHPDGLADPLGYLQLLAQRAPGAWMLVEKILAPGEQLPADWPVAGTTGYDAMRQVGGLFVDPAGAEPLSRCYTDFTAEPADFAEMVHDLKRRTATTVLRAEIRRLAALLDRAAGTQTTGHRPGEDGRRADALAELIACLPVYRTYLRALRTRNEAQAEILQGAVREATRRRPDLAATLDELCGHLLEPQPGPAAEFATRFQQTSGMVTAKGVEDTAFYRYHRLVGLNEVGGDPGLFGVPVDEFHRACAVRQRDWPLSMTALSTHDTKRSEDVRSRLALLSEIPARWEEAVGRWSGHNERHRSDGWPDRNMEYLLYQTLVGAWPLPPDRALSYVEKASREAKQHTSWTEPNPAYDEALARFVTRLLDDTEFVADLGGFVETLLEPGQITSLAQKLVQLTMPGVPDVYQGTELWDLSLVDPDNRRPVDYALRSRLLGDLAELPPEMLLARADEGLPKLFVVSRALRLRRAHPEWYGEAGSYEPLNARGAKAAHVVGFARGGAAVTIVPRLVLGLAGDWGDTTLELPAGRWRNLLTGEDTDGGVLAMQALLRRFPVALLVRDVQA